MADPHPTADDVAVADLAALIPNPGDSVTRDGYVWTMVGTWGYCGLCDAEHLLTATSAHMTDNHHPGRADG
jgi:hypothetical protein